MLQTSLPRTPAPGRSRTNLTATAGLVATAALLIACGAPGEPIGTAQEPITVCPGSATLQGVDVYSGDGTVDWTQVKSSGRAFAFVKASEGVTITDSAFAKNWAALKQAGVVRGAYHFFHADDDPMQEATFFLSVLGTLEAGDLPPTLDLEVTDGVDAATVTANAITWLDAVAKATSTKPILYCSPSFITGTLGSPAGLQDHAQLWVANWGVSCPDVPAPFTTFAFWQTSATGSVPGVPGSSGNSDVDEFNGDLAALTALTAGTSGAPPACQVNGVAGTCIDTSVCASMPGYTSTPDLCPGPASEQCCTPTGGGSSSSSSSSSTTSSAGGMGGAATGSTTGGAGTTTSSGGHATSPNGSSGCTTSPANGGAGSAAGLLAALALVRRRRRTVLARLMP